MTCTDFDAERQVAARARASGSLRAALARVARGLVARHAWERLGYARLSDYACERLGQSARTVQDWAHVGHALEYFTPLAKALESGALPWTKVRLLTRLRHLSDVEAWLPRARCMTASDLAREVRRCDQRSTEAGWTEVGPYEGPIRGVQIRCTPLVRRRWSYVLRLAYRVVGNRIRECDVAEMVAAEVLSALPLEDVARIPEPGEPDLEPADAAPTLDDDVEPDAPASGQLDPLRIAALVDGVADAEAPDLDRRLRALLALERRHEATLGPLLMAVVRRGIPRALGFATLDVWAHDRLGMDGAKLRALLRIERAAAGWSGLERAYRSGAISWVAAQALVPLALTDSVDRFSHQWAAHAAHVTVRRLRDDIERALDLSQSDSETFARTGGLPAEGEATASPSPSPSPEIGAPLIGPQTTAATEPETEQVIVGGPVAQIRLFEAVLNSVRRRLPPRDGRQATAGEALDAMIDHVIDAWDQKPSRRRAIFERDGWRCAVPGCTSQRNLHEHHVAFRSHGGGDEPENRVTLCAWHHLRGVHAGVLRIRGTAPDGLRFDLPLESYLPGERRTNRVA